MIMIRRKMSIGPTPYGTNDLHLDRFPAGTGGSNATIHELTTEETEELARLILARLGADLDDVEDLLDDARDARDNYETSQEQRYDG